jgi:IclR family transcriptional regulator, acetate operon repressor
MRQDTSRASGDTPYAVRAVLRVLDILDVLQSTPDGVALPRLAEAVGLPKSSTFRYLSTMEARGYVARDPATGNYRFGRAFLPSHTRRLQVMAARSRPLLQGLRDRFQETINLGVLDGNRVAYLEIVESTQAIRFATRTGDRDPVHSSALGKAICSQLPKDQVEAILKTEGMPQRTSRTITDPDVFLREIAVVREIGFAIDNGENEEDGRCVAVPIRGGRVRAAMSLSAPAQRFSLERAEEVAAALREAAGQVAHELEAQRAG